MRLPREVFQLKVIPNSLTKTYCFRFYLRYAQLCHQLEVDPLAAKRFSASFSSDLTVDGKSLI